MTKIAKSLTLAAVVGGVAFILANGNVLEAQDHKKKQDVTPEIKMPAPGETKSPKGAKLYFIGLKDGKKVKSKLTVRFGLKGMGVAPAGIYLGDDKPTGHHHLIINGEVPDPKLPFPMEEGKYLHFGGGQTETTIELPPGEHTLQLVLGDHIHMVHNPPVMSEKVKVIVEAE